MTTKKKRKKTTVRRSRAADAGSVDTHAAALFLGVEEETLERWRRVGDGPPYVKYGDRPRGAVRYRRNDLIAFQEARLYANTAEVRANQ